MSNPDAPSASTLFVRYLARLEAGEDVDFEALCAEHPDQADELRAYQRDWERLQPILDQVGLTGTLTERLRTAHGEGADPGRKPRRRRVRTTLPAVRTSRVIAARPQAETVGMSSEGGWRIKTAAWGSGGGPAEAEPPEPGQVKTAGAKV